MITFVKSSSSVTQLVISVGSIFVQLINLNLKYSTRTS